MSKLGLRGVNGPALVFWLQNQVLNLGCVCVCVCVSSNVKIKIMGNATP